MLNPQFVAGEHGLFGGHKSEDIRTFFSYKTTMYVLLCTPKGRIIAYGLFIVTRCVSEFLLLQQYLGR